MALAALIAAYGQVDDAGERLRATLPLVGGTLLEHQARLARRAGATHIVVLVERLPAELTAAFDRLRRDGITIEIARSAADAADHFHPDEKLLVIADGCLAGQALLDRLVACPSPAVVTVPDHGDRQMFERIDALTRWGGLALVDGGRLRRTVAMLGEWDMLSTLLRRVLQEGAVRIDAFPPDSPGGTELLLMANRAATLDGVERRLIAASRSRGDSWPSRYLFPPIEELALRPLAGTALDPGLLAAASAVAALLAVPAALAGWRWPGLILLLLSGPIASVARRLAATRLATVRHEDWSVHVRDGAAALALLALGRSVGATLGWGMLVVAGVTVCAAVALAIERRSLTALGGPPPSIWLASTDGLVWLLLPPAIAGMWGGGVVALAAYALLSFFLVQRAVLRAAGPRSAG